MKVGQFKVFNISDHALLVGLFCLAFFLYSFLAVSTPRQFSSPDEAANYFFAVQWSRSFDPKFPIPFDVVRSDFLHPRSTISAGGAILPVSFLGFPLFSGMIAKLFTQNAIVFVTPALAALGVVCFYSLMRRLFARYFACAGAAILLFHPAYWYNATRSLFHNVGFVAFLVVSAFFLFNAVQSQKKRDFIVGGIAAGLALTFRTSEAPWIFLAGLFLFLRYRKKTFQKGWFLFVGAFLLAFTPILFYNTLLFHDPFQFGYGAATTAVDQTVASSTRLPLFSALFPFGVDIGRSIHYAWLYIGKFFFWFTPFLILGVTLFLSSLFRGELKERRLSSLIPWSWVTLIAAAWLILVYGSWNFREYQGSHDVILGSSYLRYWLPIFLFAIPYIVIGLQWFAQLLSARATRRVFVAGISVFILFSWNTVFFAPLYGLRTVRSELLASDALLSTVKTILPSDAVIISGKADKVLFPTYFVVTEIHFDNPEHRRFLRDAFTKRPVYLLLNTIEQDEKTYLALAEFHRFSFRRGLYVSAYQKVFHLEGVPQP